MMKSFLSERKQFVQIHGQKSQSLLTGPQSVVQGSSISCILFLIFVLDLPHIFHGDPHSPMEQLNCDQPNAKTFVDDVGIVITKKKDNANESLRDLVIKAMDKVADYTSANKLALNQDKSLIMVVSKG